MKQINDAEFYANLYDIIEEMRVSEILGIPGVYEILSEHFNNDVLEKFEEERDRKCPLFDECEKNGYDLPPFSDCPLKKISEYTDCEYLENDEIEIIEKYMEKRKNEI